MGFTATMKAYWRESPNAPRTCTSCKAPNCRTWQTGHKPRRSKTVHWWEEVHLCDACKKALPDTAPL